MASYRGHGPGRGNLILLIALCAAFASCSDSSPANSQQYVILAFEGSRCEISTDRINHRSGEPFTVTAQVWPRLRSKGSMKLIAIGRDSTDTTFVLRPYQDTLLTFSTIEMHVPARFPYEFLPDQPAIIEWVIRRPDRHYSDLYVRCVAVADSIFLPDSNRYFYYNAPEIKEFARPMYGVRPDAQSEILKVH